MIEPRNLQPWELTPSEKRKATLRVDTVGLQARTDLDESRGPTGVLEQGMDALGTYRNLGDPAACTWVLAPDEETKGGVMGRWKS